jgi:hypothetical protein
LNDIKIMDWKMNGRKLSSYNLCGGAEENSEKLVSRMMYELGIFQIQGRSITA